MPFCSTHTQVTPTSTGEIYTVAMVTSGRLDKTMNQVKDLLQCPDSIRTLCDFVLKFTLQLWSCCRETGCVVTTWGWLPGNWERRRLLGRISEMQLLPKLHHCHHDNTYYHGNSAELPNVHNYNCSYLNSTLSCMLKLQDKILPPR